MKHENTAAATGVLLIGVGYLIIIATRAIRDRNRRFSRIVFSEISINQTVVKGEFTDMELKEGQKAVIIATPKTKGGHAAGIEAGSARWSSSDESVLKVIQDPTNELGVEVENIDGSHNESVVLELRADADRGAGVREIIGVMAIVCTQGDAFVFELETVSISDDVSDAPEQPDPTPVPDSNAGSGDAGSDVAAGGPATDPTADSSDTPATAPDSGSVSTGGDSGVFVGGSGDEVKAGDPGTATGEPIKTDAAGDGVALGEVGGTTDPAMTDAGAGDGAPIAGDAQPIAGGVDTTGQDNPVTGTEADSTKPAGDDVASPSNLPGTGGNGF